MPHVIAAVDHHLTSPTRLAALRATGLLDRGDDSVLDRLTRLATRLLGVPISHVTLVGTNRQYFVGRSGDAESDPRSNPIEYSFCKYVVATSEPLVVRDASAEPLVRDNPSHRELGVIAYAGVPLVTSDGETLGAFCAIDRQTRDWSEDDLETLRDLAVAAVAELELRTTVQALAESREHLLATQAQFREQAVRDDLTGLLNRRGLDEMVRQQLALALRSGRPCLLLSLDLDGFKEINDTFGHAVGDHALVDMAGVLRQTFRESDVLARMGGDEFVILVSNSGPTDVEVVRGRLYAALAARDEGAERPYRLAASAGVAAFDPAAPTSYAELLRAADANMYAEKRRPRDAR